MRTSRSWLELGAGEALVAVEQALDDLDLEDGVAEGLRRSVVDLAGETAALGLLGLHDAHLGVGGARRAAGSVTRLESSRARNSQAFSRDRDREVDPAERRALLADLPPDNELVGGRTGWACRGRAGAGAPPSARPARGRRRGSARGRRGGSWRPRRRRPGPRRGGPRGDRPGSARTLSTGRRGVSAWPCPLPFAWPLALAGCFGAAAAEPLWGSGRADLERRSSPIDVVSPRVPGAPAAAGYPPRLSSWPSLALGHGTSGWPNGPYPMVPEPTAPPTSATGSGCGRPGCVEVAGVGRESGSWTGTKQSAPAAPPGPRPGRRRCSRLDDDVPSRWVEGSRQVEDRVDRLVRQGQRVVPGLLGEPDREVRDDRPGLGGEVDTRAVRGDAGERGRDRGVALGVRARVLPSSTSSVNVNSRQPAIAKAGPSQATGFVQPRRRRPSR